MDGLWVKAYQEHLPPRIGTSRGGLGDVSSELTKITPQNRALCSLRITARCTGFIGQNKM